MHTSEALPSWMAVIAASCPTRGASEWCAWDGTSQLTPLVAADCEVPSHAHQSDALQLTPLVVADCRGLGVLGGGASISSLGCMSSKTAAGRGL